MNKRLTGLVLGMVSGMALAGCFTLREPAVNYYAIGAGLAGGGEKLAIRVAVQRMEGRAQYRRPRIVVSPREFVLDSYTSAQWTDDPCDMLTDGLMTYLARSCEYVTAHPRAYKDAVRYIVVPYLDACDHVRRGGVWHAQLRVKYDIVDDETRTVVVSEWFERERVLSGSSVAEYVAAQQESVNEWYAAVLAALEKAGKGSGEVRVQNAE